MSATGIDLSQRPHARLRSVPLVEVRAEVRRFHSPDIADLAGYAPPDPTSFAFLLQVMAVTSINLKSIAQRGWLSLSTIVAIALVVVVLLTGGSAVSGPTAAGVAGNVYKNLSAGNYFAKRSTIVATKRPSPSNPNHHRALPGHVFGIGTSGWTRKVTASASRAGTVRMRTRSPKARPGRALQRREWVPVCSIDPNIV